MDKLYRKDAKGNISVWYAYPSTGEGHGDVTIEHGRLDGNITKEFVNTHRYIEDEIKSRYKAKYKQGYKSLADVKDNSLPPVEGSLIDYLSKYLPEDRTTADGSLLPMLAKVYNNTNNKLFINCPIYSGQWKINGLRCFIRCEEVNDGFFNYTRFTFQSREGTYWNSLDTLNEYLLYTLPNEFIKLMIKDEIVLDGELYLPGASLNIIDSAVKNVNNPINKYIQFWCYDIAIPDTVQHKRDSIIFNYLNKFMLYNFNNKKEHLDITTKFNVLPIYDIRSQNDAIYYRNLFIDVGFEGLIMRNPDIEYEYGKRKMIKFKKHTDGIFALVDIVPDGIKRPDVGKFICKNDINEALFECHISDTIENQKLYLKYKDNYLGKGRHLHIEYMERSGVNKVPFHIKNVRWTAET